MRRAGRMLVAAACALVARAAPASADEPGEETAESPATSIAPAPPPPAPATPALPPTGVEAPAAHPSAEDRWPLETVRRPLVLPAGMASFGLQLAGHRPKNHLNVRPTDGSTYLFNSSVAAGVSLALGIEDTQLSVFVPELLCFATETPSGCDGINKHTGTGGGLSFLAYHAHGFQIAPAGRVSVARTSPTVLRWSLGSAFKYTASDVLALYAAPGLARNFNNPTGLATNPWLAYLPGELEVQATQRLLVFAIVEPWGSLGDVSRGILLEVYGGTAYTFGAHGLGQVTLEAGTYNVLSQPVWNTNVPEWFGTLSLTFWKQ